MTEQMNETGDVPVTPHSDKLIAEAQELQAALAQLPASAPADAPVLLELHQIQSNRRLRANVAKLGPLMDRLKANDQATRDQGDGATLGETEAVVLMADIEEFLEAFAADPGYYRSWAQTHDDQDLIALLASFVRRGVNQGEAFSSSN